jgi:hypothetical protein
MMKSDERKVRAAAVLSWGLGLGFGAPGAYDSINRRWPSGPVARQPAFVRGS